LRVRFGGPFGGPYLGPLGPLGLWVFGIRYYRSYNNILYLVVSYYDGNNIPTPTSGGGGNMGFRLVNWRLGPRKGLN